MAVIKHGLVICMNLHGLYSHESACTFFLAEACLIMWQSLHALSLTFVHTC